MRRQQPTLAPHLARRRPLLATLELPTVGRRGHTQLIPLGLSQHLPA
eukprot:COSAG01_NODE_26598_length_708_cov_3.060755_1_plen_46_part_10